MNTQMRKQCLRMRRSETSTHWEPLIAALYKPFRHELEILPTGKVLHEIVNGISGGLYFNQGNVYVSDWIPRVKDTYRLRLPVVPLSPQELGKCCTTKVKGEMEIEIIWAGIEKR